MTSLYNCVCACVAPYPTEKSTRVQLQLLFIVVLLARTITADLKQAFCVLHTIIILRVILSHIYT